MSRNHSRFERISFVWNADFSLKSGIRALKEAYAGHHSCDLCDIAYHRVRQTGDWKAYKKSLRQRWTADVREPCRNQLSVRQKDASAGAFPCVLIEQNGKIRKVLDARTIAACDGQFEPFRQALEAALEKASNDPGA